MKKVKKKEAVRLLEQAVEAKGRDYRYPSSDYNYIDNNGFCQYFTRNEKAPACIVGHVIASLGVESSDLKVSTFSASELNDNQDKVFFTKKAREVLSSAQEAQDQKDTWGHALDEAKATARALS